MAKTLDWIKAHYDRVALIAAGVFLFISAVSIWWNAIQFGNRLVAQPGRLRKMRRRQLSRLNSIAQRSVFNVLPNGNPVLAPDFLFRKNISLVRTVCRRRCKTHRCIRLSQMIGSKSSVYPIQDADVLEQDPDGDGFTNLDEWQGGTDPTSKDSHPDYLTKLHLVSATEEPFRFVFASWVGDTFALNTIDQSEPTQFLKVGDVIRGTDFKIVKFTEKHERNQYGTNIDVSELLLKHQDTHAQVTLVKEKIATSPQSVATFVYTWGGRREFEVRKDQEFSLKPVEEINYKLVDVQPNKAVIVNTQKPNARIEIGFAPP